ncbi:MAG: peptidase U32 family protein, partial [Sphaerochaetaceae bacterium]
MIELTLPAGSLQAALHAFAGGADAVYLGMQQYSARKGAINFSFEELAKLKQEAVRQDKRVYVTVNTLLDDRELDQAVPLLRQLELLRPDGIIVQDLGVASLLRREFPSLPIHSSTQGAVHTAEGVRMMQDLGFSRIVLSRELTFDAIARIRKECP